MAEWRSSGNDLDFPEGGEKLPPLTLTVEAGGGSVQIQHLQSDGATWLPVEGEGTLTESGVYKIDRSNGPQMRIVATGSAKFIARGR